MSSIALELLAPAKNADIGKAAVDCGADAVYIGASALGARASACNSADEIAELVKYAHTFGVRVYVTLNTIVFEHELKEARDLAMQMYDIGADALIVQDMAYVMMKLPIALHASTQCDIRTPAKAAMLARAGFRRLVLPREFGARQIREVATAANVPIEVFIHGARCVSYSGDCQMGFAATGRSANRGVCPQMCRLPYDLVDGSGKKVARRRHYLSLSDMATEDIETLIAAGATSFKIEGRLKDRRYVANAVAWYSRQLDHIVAQSGGRYRRASFGSSVPGFEADAGKCFFRRPNGGGTEACLDYPNDAGEPVGVTKSGYSALTRSFTIDATAPLANGDGLGCFIASSFCGFRLNRIAGAECFPAAPIPGLRAGSTIYRNADKTFNDTVDKAKPSRRLTIDLDLSYRDNVITLTAADTAGRRAQATAMCEISPAHTPQQMRRRDILTRLGKTPFSPGIVTDNVGAGFIPVSVLAQLRRAVTDSLCNTSAVKPEEPGRCVLTESELDGIELDYHDNIANSMSRLFYISHGATIREAAVECGPASHTVGRRVMSTRYCIRREIGACLRSCHDDKLPQPLFLQNEYGLYRLDFDCSRCGMSVVRIK